MKVFLVFLSNYDIIIKEGWWMMKKRVVSGAILLFLLITCMAFNSKLFAILILVFGILGFNEFISLKFNKQDITVVKVIGIMSLILSLFNNIFYKVDTSVIVIVPLLGLTLPILFYNDYKKYNINDALYVIGAVFFLSFSFGTLISLRDISILYAIFIFLIAFVTDTYAYLGGCLIGKHKLTSISPKKTWEGVIVGTFMGTVVGSVFYYLLIGDISIIGSIGLCLFLTIMSELGDLVFSSIKRYFNVKDYSDLIPGHGGILDRFDSVIYVSLTMALMINLF